MMFLLALWLLGALLVWAPLRWLDRSVGFAQAFWRFVVAYFLVSIGGFLLLWALCATFLTVVAR